MTEGDHREYRISNNDVGIKVKTNRVKELNVKDHSLVPSIQDTLVGGGGGGCGVKINLTPEVFELAQIHVARASHDFSR